MNAMLLAILMIKTMSTEIGSDIPPEFWQGVEEFNRGDFYACHDTLEAIWMESIEPDRTFYQGLIQIAVSLYHLGNHNWQGCVTLMGEGIRRLGSYQPDYFQIEVTPLVIAAQQLLSTLQHAGPEEVGAIAHQIQVHYPCHTCSPTPPTADHQYSTMPVPQVPQTALPPLFITRIMGE